MNLELNTFLKSPINYVGSKYNLLPHLVELFPSEVSTFIDLFTGGGSVYMNVASKYKYVIANDSLKELIDIHKNLRNVDYVTYAQEVSKETISNQASYLSLRDEYNKSFDSRLLLALIWSCNSNLMRFNQRGYFNQTWGRRGWNSSKKKIYDAFCERPLENVKFTSLDFAQLIGTLDMTDTFVYLDPPYSNTNAGYNSTWSKVDDTRLILLLESFIRKGTLFGISGVENDIDNPIYNFLIKQNLVKYSFGDFYKKAGKRQKVNDEYYFTNVSK